MADIAGPALVVIATGAAALAIGLYQHYQIANLVSLTVGILLFTAILAWTDPNPDLHIYKILLAGIGAGMWVSAVRDERRLSSRKNEASAGR